MSKTLLRDGDVYLETLVDTVAHDPMKNPFPVIDMDHVRFTVGNAASPRLGPELPDWPEPPDLNPAAAARTSTVLPDLDVRVYTPIPEVVIVRVGGAVDRFTAPVLAQRVGKQLTRAPHVVVDLGNVTAVDPRGLAILRTLHDQATASGTEIHITRAEDDTVRHALQTTGLDELFSLDPTAETVIANFRPVAITKSTSSGSRQGTVALIRRASSPCTKQGGRHRRLGKLE
jgi:anti-anti-sigma factor